MLDPALLAPEKLRPLRSREYEQLVDLGAFEDERVELLRGQLVTMSPQGASHATVTARIAQQLIRMLDDSFDVRSHSPFAATDDSEPEPDVSVSRRRLPSNEAAARCCDRRRCRAGARGVQGSQRALIAQRGGT